MLNRAPPAAVWPIDPEIIYCRTREEAQRIGLAIAREAELGIDAKVLPNIPDDPLVPESFEEEIQILVLASERTVAIFHLALYPDTSVDAAVPALSEVLQSRSIVKCGVDVANGLGRQLRKDLGVTPGALFELSRLHALRLAQESTQPCRPATIPPSSLRNLVDHYYPGRTSSVELTVPSRYQTDFLSLKEQRAIGFNAHAAIVLFHTMATRLKNADIPAALPTTISFLPPPLAHALKTDWQEDGDEMALKIWDLEQSEAQDDYVEPLSGEDRLGSLHPYSFTTQTSKASWGEEHDGSGLYGWNVEAWKKQNYDTDCSQENDQQRLLKSRNVYGLHTSSVDLSTGPTASQSSDVSGPTSLDIEMLDPRLREVTEPLSEELRTLQEARDSKLRPQDSRYCSEPLQQQQLPCTETADSPQKKNVRTVTLQLQARTQDLQEKASRGDPFAPYLLYVVDQYKARWLQQKSIRTESAQVGHVLHTQYSFRNISTDYSAMSLSDWFSIPYFGPESDWDPWYTDVLIKNYIQHAADKTTSKASGVELASESDLIWINVAERGLSTALSEICSAIASFSQPSDGNIEQPVRPLPGEYLPDRTTTVVLPWLYSLNHWLLISIKPDLEDENRIGEILIHDGYDDLDADADARKLMPYFAQLLGLVLGWDQKSWKISKGPAPVQRDGHSCGPFVADVARRLLTGTPLTYNNGPGGTRVLAERCRLQCMRDLFELYMGKDIIPSSTSIDGTMQTTGRERPESLAPPGTIQSKTLAQGETSLPADDLVGQQTAHSSSQQYRPHIAAPLTAIQTQKLPSTIQLVIGSDGYINKESLLGQITGGVPCYFRCGSVFKSFAQAAVHLAHKSKLEESGILARLGHHSREVDLERINKHHDKGSLRQYVPSTVEAFDGGEATIGWCSTALRQEGPTACPFRCTLGDHIKCEDLFEKTDRSEIAVENAILSDHEKHQLIHNKLGELPPGLPCRCGLLWASPHFAALHILTPIYGGPCKETALPVGELFAFYANEKQGERPMKRQDILAAMMYPTKLNPTQLNSLSQSKAIDLQGTTTGETGIPSLQDHYIQSRYNQDDKPIQQTYLNPKQVFETIPPQTELVVFPFRHSSGRTKAPGSPQESKLDTDSKWKHSRAIAGQYTEAFNHYTPVLIIDFFCPSIYTPIFAGGRQWKALGSAHNTNLRTSALVTDMIFQLLTSRPADKRIVLAIADSWTCCDSLLALACVQHDFRLRIALTDHQVSVADSPGDETTLKLREVFAAGDARYHGHYYARHWFELTSQEIACAFAGTTQDHLARRYIRWCRQSQDSKSSRSLGRSSKPRNKSSIRKTMEQELQSVGEEVQAILRSRATTLPQPTTNDTFLPPRPQPPQMPWDTSHIYAPNADDNDDIGADYVQSGSNLLLPSWSAVGLTATQISNLPEAYQSLIDSSGYIDPQTLCIEVPGGVPCHYRCGRMFRTHAQTAAHVLASQKLSSVTLQEQLGFRTGEVGGTGKFRAQGSVEPGLCCVREKSFKKVQCPFRESLGTHISCDSVIRNEVHRSRSRGRIMFNDLKNDFAIHQGRVNLPSDMPYGLPCRCGLMWPAPAFAAIHLLTDANGPRCRRRALSVEEFLSELTPYETHRLRAGYLNLHLPVQQAGNNSNKRVMSFTREADSNDGNASDTGSDVDSSDKGGTDPDNDKGASLARSTVSMDEFVPRVPVFGPLVIFPYRQSSAERMRLPTRKTYDNWLGLINQHQEVFQTEGPAVEIHFHCASAMTPVFAGTREWSITHSVRIGDPSFRQTDAYDMIHRSALVSDTIFRLFQTRAPHERILLAVADSWTCCVPLLAFACTLLDFRIHLALTESQASLMDSQAEYRAQQSWLETLVAGSDPRYHGFHHGRHWLVLESKTVARVFARLEQDLLVEGCLSSLDSIQRSKNTITLGRSERVKAMQSVRQRCESVLVGMRGRVRDMIRSQEECEE